MAETSGSITVSTKLQRIAELAKKAPQMAFTTLAHHMDLEWLREAHRRTRKDGAPGIDQQTAEQYAERLDENLGSLLERANSGQYRAPAVRRVSIPKGDGKTRPLGIPTFEDKVLQRASVMVLEAVYEQDFLECSYGFRPERSAHQAIQELWDRMMEMGGGWVLEVDIKSFFDTIDHKHLREILNQRIRDGVLTRLIGKWLNAGVQEGKELTYPEMGTPQGGVISPLLANIYLHEVLDKWFEEQVKPRLSGRAFLIRYADDFVICFSGKEDAQRVMEVLYKRFEKYGLTLHPEKTKLVPFQHPQKGGEEGSFELLGFVHYWGKSQQGSWVIKRKTAPNRVTRTLERIRKWCKVNLHKPLMEQLKALTQKLLGHFAYFGIMGNAERQKEVRRETTRIWRKSLGRRNSKILPWSGLGRVMAQLPEVKTRRYLNVAKL